ncbi:MAG: nucleotide-binding protein [Phycisphaerae bacterium]|nr:nucleotide-binding protein [Phycisphaerae bacterium]
MSELHEELLGIAEKMELYAEEAKKENIILPLSELGKAANTVGKAWSRSWLGYHACVYYNNFEVPPPGAHFSQEWGMEKLLSGDGTIGDWCEYNNDDVVNTIHALAGNPNLDSVRELSEKAKNALDTEKHEVLSILSTTLSKKPDSFISNLKDDVEKLNCRSQSQVIKAMRPSGRVISRDSLAVTQGFHTPPHILVLSEVIALQNATSCCEKLSKIVRRAGSHLARQTRRSARSKEIGTNVFIGHGRSAVWKDVKDFIQDRLSLPWDEFNRVPVAGITNIARLSEMLDAAAIAFLVMTGEDEQADGKLQARMNVVHEAGLFQGRLGFTRAIVLIEDGCEEFSNIQGLGQIRFPKSNIKAAFEEIRQVLERERILDVDEPT